MTVVLRGCQLNYLTLEPDLYKYMKISVVFRGIVRNYVALC